MGLFDKLLGRKTHRLDAIDVELAAMVKDGRMHARMRLHDDTVATLALPNHLIGRVVDISYGGIAASFAGAKFPLQEGLQCEGSLKILGASTALLVTTIRVVAYHGDAAMVGFCLHHQAAGGLLFLRDFIEPSRCGESLALIGPELRQDRYQGSEWHCWRGDGPTDLIAQTHPGTGALSEAILTFRLNKTYCELTFKGGLLQVGIIRQEDESSLLNGTARAMASNVDDEVRVLRAGLYILQASPAPCRALSAPMIALARDRLLLPAGGAV